MDGPIEIVDTEWWLNHMDELVAALHVAAELPDADQAITPWWASKLIVSSPQWALEHIDELRAGLEEGANRLGPQPEPRISDLLRNAKPPDDHSEDRGHGR